MRANGSVTSGVDGSSEGGRIDSIRTPWLLELYGISLIQVLHDSGEHGQMAVRPIQVDGVWYLELTVGPGFASAVPERWQGRRVLLHHVADAVAGAHHPGTLGGFTPPPSLHTDDVPQLNEVTSAGARHHELNR